MAVDQPGAGMIRRGNHAGLVTCPVSMSAALTQLLPSPRGQAAWFYVAGLLTRRAAGKRNRMVAVVLSWCAHRPLPGIPGRASVTLEAQTQGGGGQEILSGTAQEVGGATGYRQPSHIAAISLLPKCCHAHWLVASATR